MRCAYVGDVSRRSVRLTTLIVSTTIGFFAAIEAARSHSFYSWECCHDRDCWPTGGERDAKEPDPTYTSAGWRFHDGVIVPFDKTRASPDGRFHVCRQGAALTGAVIRPRGKTPCVWAPVPAL
jgi:hypothetical protein